MPGGISPSPHDSPHPRSAFTPHPLGYLPHFCGSSHASKGLPLRRDPYGDLPVSPHPSPTLSGRSSHPPSASTRRSPLHPHPPRDSPSRSPPLFPPFPPPPPLPFPSPPSRFPQWLCGRPPAGGGVRLANGNGSCRGRVEVRHGGTWGTVCDDDWDFPDAQVVCRQLGCGPAVSATVLGSFGYGSGPVLLDNVGCDGHEMRLADCFHLGWGQHNCGHHEDAGVVCRGAWSEHRPSCPSRWAGVGCRTGVRSQEDGWGCWPRFWHGVRFAQWLGKGSAPQRQWAQPGAQGPGPPPQDLHPLPRDAPSSFPGSLTCPGGSPHLPTIPLIPTVAFPHTHWATSLTHIGPGGVLCRAMSWTRWSQVGY